MRILVLDALQNGLTKWKSLYNNFVTLMRHASKEEILSAIKSGIVLILGTVVIHILNNVSFLLHVCECE